MKKFKQPLAIKGSKEELESLIQSLKELGYEFTNSSNSFYNEGEDLITNCDSIVGSLAYIKIHCYERLQVPASNKDLCLALAGMVEGGTVELGEYRVVEDNLMRVEEIRESDKWFRSRDAYFISYSGERNKNYFNHKTYRKATTEEIINHFKQKDMKKKKIVGYKLKDSKYRSAVRAIVDRENFDFKGFEKQSNLFSICESELKEAKVLDLWFEPVYEEEKKIIKVSHSNGVLEVEIRGRGDLAFTEEGYYAKSDLYSLINPLFNNHAVRINNLDIGCKKNISREDIQKVIDALN